MKSRIRNIHKTNKNLITKTSIQVPIIKSSSPPNTACICAIAKYEDLYIDEWIKYNLHIGFNAIYLYDNSDEFTLKNINLKYPGKVFVKHYPGPKKQIEVYNSFGTNPEYKKLYKWCAFIDCDEFIVLKKYLFKDKTPSIIDFLNEYCNNPMYSAICLNWYLFGFNGENEYRPEYVTKRFTTRESKGSEFIKVIVKLSDFISMSTPHDATTLRGTRSVDGRVILNSCNKNPNMDIAYINHYFCKSLEEFNNKMSRGRATCSLKRTIETYKKEYCIKDDMTTKDLTLYNFIF